MGSWEDSFFPHQRENEAAPIAAQKLGDFEKAVGVEGRVEHPLSGEIEGFSMLGGGEEGVADFQCCSSVLQRELDNKRAEHILYPLHVAVEVEEASGLVKEEFVELRGDVPIKRLREVIEDELQRFLGELGFVEDFHLIRENLVCDCNERERSKKSC